MKNDKKIILSLIILLIGLFFCTSLILYNHSIKNSKKNVIDIEDCTGKDCNKNNDNNQKEDKKTNNDSDNNTNINPSSGGTGGYSGSGTSSNGSTSGGSGTGDGNDSESESGSGSGTGSESSDSSGYGTTPSDEPAKNVVVNDNNTIWNQDTSLKIFNVDKIAPGDNGYYEFAINNNTDGNIVYSIDFDEKNQYNANLLYKLKMNNNYIAGNSDTWVSSSELGLNNKVLDSNYMDSFYLEWKWVDSNHDTIAGITPNANYTLNVKVSSKETTDHDTSGSGSINPITGDRIIIYIEILLGSVIATLIIILLKRKKNENN